MIKINSEAAQRKSQFNAGKCSLDSIECIRWLFRFHLQHISTFLSSFGRKNGIVIGVCEGLDGIIDIPDGVERIEKNAFLRSKVEKVNFPKSVRLIGESTFANCAELRTVTI